MKPQDSEIFYKSLFDNMTDGLAYCRVVFDAAGYPVDFVYVRANKKFNELMGVKNVAGKKAAEIIPEIHLSNPDLLEICARVALTGEPEKLETYIEPIAGWFLVSVYSPRTNFFVAMFQDISDRKQIEKKLENAKIAARNVLEDLSAEKLRAEIAQAKEEAILLSIGEGLIATDEKGYIVLINKTAEKLLDVKSEEVMGKSIGQVIPIEDERGMPVPPESRLVNMALAGRCDRCHAAQGINYYYARKDKTKFPVASMVAPVILDGKVIGAIEVFRDVTREREIDKTKTEFVSIASHQLRTPLSSVSWHAEMLLTGDVGKLNKEQKKYLNEVYRGNQRMVKLVNALLNVSRLELGTFAVNPEPIDMVDLVRSVVDEQKKQIDQKKITFSLVFEKNIPAISADPKLLRMVAQNLLSNAVKYTSEKGKIKFSLSLDDGKKFILLKVSDTGCGISEHQQDKIFTKFFRADNAREKDTEGTGLGLYIAKSIIDQAGGSVRFESKENIGTIFYATLPLAGMQKKEKNTAAD